MKTFLGLILVFLSPAALACFAPPASLFRDHSALISEANTIVVVQADAIADGCELRVVRTLKGVPPKERTVKCRIPGPGDWMTSFSGHRDSSFWEGRGGRLGVQADCSAIAPAFEVGRSYLLLLGVQSDTKQFEQIDDSGDKWLHFVEQTLEGHWVPSNKLFKSELRGWD